MNSTQTDKWLNETTKKIENKICSSDGNIELEKWEFLILTFNNKIDYFDSSLKAIDQKNEDRIYALDQKLDGSVQALEKSIHALDQKNESRIYSLEQKIDAQDKKIEKRIDELSSLFKWMLGLGFGMGFPAITGLVVVLFKYAFFNS